MHTSILITKNYIAYRVLCKYAMTLSCYPRVNGLRLIDGILRLHARFAPQLLGLHPPNLRVSTRLRFASIRRNVHKINPFRAIRGKQVAFFKKSHGSQLFSKNSYCSIVYLYTNACILKPKTIHCHQELRATIPPFHRYARASLRRERE